VFPFSFLTLSLIYLFFLFGFNFFGCFLLIYHLLIYFLFSFLFILPRLHSLPSITNVTKITKNNGVDIFRRVGPREGEVQVYHRRFGPDFLRTFGILELSTLLLLLPIILGCLLRSIWLVEWMETQLAAPFWYLFLFSWPRTYQHSTTKLVSERWMYWLPRSIIF